MKLSGWWMTYCTFVLLTSHRPCINFWFSAFTLVFADKTMLNCVLRCSTTAGRTFKSQGHWQCAYCLQICERKNAMTVHLNTHLKVKVSGVSSSKNAPKKELKNSGEAPKGEKASLLSSESNLVCPECSKAYPHNKAL